MYLRKSRMDTDFDDVSVEETLNRHRRILESFCKERRLNVVETLEEVVSGESLSARPQMLRLLDLVNTGIYAGVVCVDIERLSRGSSLESGYIMQVLQTNSCKIITPSKIYDLQNESDEQFTDMKFMFSRYELKTITKRLVRGRNQSASEGKFLGSMAPYGYRSYKLPGTKGSSLQIEPGEAEIVRLIFDMYGKQGIGYNTIAYQLNQMHIPSRTGTWGQTSIANILNNEVYLGMIRWRHEPTKRVVKDGMLVKKRVKSHDYELYEGLHDPIVTQEQWDAVRAKQRERGHVSVNTNRKLANPFASMMKELRKLQVSEDDLLKQKESKSSTKSIEAEVIPTTQRILDSYPHLSVEEKNRLWKIVMKKITMYRTPEGDFTLHIYPKLPMGNTP